MTCEPETTASVTATMRVLRAAIKTRHVDMSRCTGASVLAWKNLYEAVDALALVGGISALETLIDEK